MKIESKPKKEHKPLKDRLSSVVSWFDNWIYSENSDKKAVARLIFVVFVSATLFVGLMSLLSILRAFPWAIGGCASLFALWFLHLVFMPEPKKESE